jgi:hypothetical protein
MAGHQDVLILKSAATRPGGPWPDDDYDVLHEGKPVGRIMLMSRADEQAWMCSIFFEARKPGRPYKCHAVDREDAMKQFAAAWRADSSIDGTGEDLEQPL